MLVAASFLAASSGLLLAVTPSQPTPSLNKSQKKEYRDKVRRRLERLGECDRLPACDQCAAAQHALLDGSERAPLTKGARDVHNRAMALCVGEPRVVEALFEEVAAAGVASESSYAVLMRALVDAGELAEAAHVLRRLIATESFLPRVNSPRPASAALSGGLCHLAPSPFPCRHSSKPAPRYKLTPCSELAPPAGAHVRAAATRARGVRRTAPRARPVAHAAASGGRVHASRAWRADPDARARGRCVALTAAHAHAHACARAHARLPAAHQHLADRQWPDSGVGLASRTCLASRTTPPRGKAAPRT